LIRLLHVDTRAIGRVLIHHKIPGAHRKKKWTVGTGSVQTTGRKQRCVRKKYVDTYTITYKMQVKLYFL